MTHITPNQLKDIENTFKRKGIIPAPAGLVRFYITKKTITTVNLANMTIDVKSLPLVGVLT